MRELTKWDHRFFALAEMVSSWSKDPSTKCGAVIVDGDNAIVSVGFNGFPKGILDSDRRLEDRDYKYPVILHAEVNAIYYARGRDLKGCRIYTHPFGPCVPCASRIVQNKMSEALFPIAAPDKERWQKEIEFAKKMFAETGISFYEKE